MAIEAEDRLQGSEATFSRRKSHFEQIVEGLPAMVALYGADGQIIYANRLMLAYCDQTLEQLRAGLPAYIYHPDDQAEVVRRWRSSVRTGDPFDVEGRLCRVDGAYRWHRIQGFPLRHPDGRIDLWYGHFTDIDDTKGAEAKLAAEKQLLELVARGVGLPETLRAICLQVEALAAGCVCSVFLVDTEAHRLRVGAAPSLPDDYRARIDGKSLDPEDGPLALSIATKVPVIAPDVIRDPRWARSVWPQRAVEAGFASCWAVPVMTADEQVVAVFALYHQEPQFPTAGEQELIDRFTHIAGIAIERAGADAALKQREAELERAYEFLNEAQRLSRTGSFTWDAHPETQFWSDEMYRTLELEPGTLVTLEMARAVIHPDDLPIYDAMVARGQAGEVMEATYRIVTPSGAIKHLRTMAHRLSQVTDRAVYLGASQDVTDSKLAEEALRDSEAKLTLANQHLVEAQKLSRIGSFRADVLRDDYVFSDEMYRIWELDLGSRITTDAVRARLHPDDLSTFEVQFARVAAGGDSDLTFRIVTPNGEVKHIHSVVRLLGYVDGRPVHMGVQQDETERILAAEALRASEAKLRQVNQHLIEAQKLSRVGSYTLDLRRGERTVSDELRRIWEFEPDGDITAQELRQRLHPNDLALYDAEFALAAAGGASELAFRIVTPSGRTKYLRSVTRLLEYVDGRPIHIGVQQDETERVVAAEALRSSEAELRRAHELLTEAQRISKTGSFAWDVGADEHNWSDEIYRLFDIDPTAKLTMAMVLARVHPDDVPAAQAVIGGALEGRPFEMAFRIVTASGEVRHAHVIAHPDAQIADRVVYIGAMQDVTESKRAEEALDRARAELAHVSRMATLSALTASIAHEVNQPLAGIITNANTCLRMLASDPPDLDGARATAQRTIRDGNRAAEVIARLRALFSKRAANREAVDLNDAAREVLALSTADLQRAQVRVRTHLAADLPPVIGDRVQLQQVILNLLLNAADAMTGVEDRERELTIASQRDGAGRARLDVRDTGVGLESVNVEALFEPFHTTKPSGMGVGLSISRSIIEGHDGRLWAEPNDGRGATFAFTVPVSLVTGARDAADREGLAGPAE